MAVKEVNEDGFLFVICGCFYANVDLSDQFQRPWFAGFTFHCVSCSAGLDSVSTPQGLGLNSVSAHSGLGLDLILTTRPICMFVQYKLRPR